MSRANAYIFRHLISYFLVITLSLVGVMWLTQSLRFIDLIINKGLSFGLFIYMTALILPGLLSIILPVAAFCAALYTYQRLKADSELQVLQSAGLSPWSIIRPGILFIVVLILLQLLFELVLAPMGHRESGNLRFALRNNYSLVLLQEGVFNTVIPGITIYVRERNAGGELKGILAYDDRDKGSPVTMMAESGQLIRTEEGPRFVLVNGNRQELSRDQKDLSILYFDHYVLDLEPYTEATAERWSEPRERYLHELFAPPATASDRVYVDELRSEGHRRLSAPYYTAMMVMLALATVLSGQFERRGQWRRILAGAVAAIVVEAIGLGLLAAMDKNLSIAPLVYLFPIAVLVGSVWCLSDRGPLNRRLKWIRSEIA